MLSLFYSWDMDEVIVYLVLAIKNHRILFLKMRYMRVPYFIEMNILFTLIIFQDLKEKFFLVFLVFLIEIIIRALLIMR